VGDLTARVRLPTALTPDTCLVRVIGPVPVAASINLVAAGGVGTSIVSLTVAEPPIRQRPPGKAIGLVTLFGILAGLFFASTAQPANVSPGAMATPDSSSQAGDTA